MHSPNVQRKQISILWVDDGINELHFLIPFEFWTSPEYKMDFASTGEVGIRKLKDNHYDLSIMDVRLRDIDGIELVNKIRNGELGESLKAIPILVFTAGSYERAVTALGSANVYQKSAGMDSQDFKKMINTALNISE